MVGVPFACILLLSLGHQAASETACPMTAAGQGAVKIDHPRSRMGCGAGGKKECCFCVNNMDVCAKAFGPGACKATDDARSLDGYDGCKLKLQKAQPPPKLQEGSEQCVDCADPVDSQPPLMKMGSARPDNFEEQCVYCEAANSTLSDNDALSYLARITRISIPSEAIRRDDRTTFYTLVLTLSDETVVQASRRYSEFDVLRKELTLVPSDGKFPKKQVNDGVCKLWNSLGSCVEDRRLGLEAYLNRAFHHINQIADKARNSQARILAAFVIKHRDDVHTDTNDDLVDSQEPLLKMGSARPDDVEDIGEPSHKESLESPLVGDPRDLINEYNDPNMGIAFTMVTKMSWEWGGHWGLADDPNSVPDGKVRHISITTRKQDMATYSGLAYGLVYHITPERNFWKHFLVRKKTGGIAAGPGDGGGGGTSGVKGKGLPESMGKNYEWFTREKKSILAKYNTVYKIHDYNEFITLGTSKQALAGIFHSPKSRKFTPTDSQMCDTLRHARGGKWPIYAYDRHSLRIERYLNC